ncbi:2-oxoglutarate dehydrogenase, E2 component, dihydrolipoamide succinyltransferase [Ruania albidiflava]|uniref:2-oxoglutarate dehydrogenase, E2 component, dihydrolipoamide succinyltransferase n=1 Tax=Ruania albidiflava TaxID=366586 RepID=UPI0003B6FF67|nr:2-oxoglutarate dehydrogenase, E2 component, dihydrolipoamide succinyltransferase [Ruania albidiflava]
MSESVKMPALGESVTEGTVTRWLKAVGEEVEVDEPLLEVSTDKVDTEVPSPVAGVVEKILVEEDETVEVGEDLVLIGSGAGGVGESPAADDAQQQESEQPAPAEPEQEQAPAAESAQEAPAQESAQEAPAGQPASGGTAQGTEVTLPALGESVTEGTVTQWLKSVGDEVAEDEPLLEVSTDKVDTEVPSPVAGTLLEIRADEDETVEVGGVLAIIGDKSAQSAAPAAQSPDPEQPKAESPEQPQQQAPKEEPKAERPAPAPAQEAAAQEPAPSPAAAKSPEAPKAASGTEAPTSYVTPLVRKLAADKGVDLSTLSGTGVGGRIRKQDVLDAAEAAAKPAPQEAPAQAPAAAKEAPAPAVSPLRGTREKMSRLRKIVAKRMVESLQVSAQLTTVLEVDVTKIARLRAQAKDDFLAREGVKLTYLPFFTMAAVEALKQYPKLNASIEGDEIVYHGSENVGIAVDTERGLIVPVIKDAGDLNLAGIARSIADLAERTRTNKATPDELTGGTFTITNTGSGGALFDTPILFQPQVGMLGVGSIVKRPVVVPGPDGGDVIAVRHMVYLAISYDHRLIDGADASRFLTAIKKRLEEGNFEGQLGL